MRKIMLLILILSSAIIFGAVIVSAQVCGDNVCETDTGETEASCPQDCTIAPPPTTCGACQSQGELISSVIDSNSLNTEWRLTGTMGMYDTSIGQMIYYYSRTSNDMIIWTDWQGPSLINTLNNVPPYGRYYQYKLLFIRGYDCSTPQLDLLSFFYQDGTVSGGEWTQDNWLGGASTQIAQLSDSGTWNKYNSTNMNTLNNGGVIILDCPLGDVDNDGIPDGVEQALTGSASGLTASSSGFTSISYTLLSDGTISIVGQTSLFGSVTVIIPQGASVPGNVLSIVSQALGNKQGIYIDGLELAGNTKSVQFRKEGNNVCIIDKPAAGADLLFQAASQCQPNTIEYRVNIQCNGQPNNFIFPDGPRTFKCAQISGTNDVIVSGLKYSLVVGFNDNDNDNWVVDCNDNNPAINPGAAEACDGIDNDCSGQIDDMAGTMQPFGTNIVLGSAIDLVGGTDLNFMNSEGAVLDTPTADLWYFLAPGDGGSTMPVLGAENLIDWAVAQGLPIGGDHDGTPLEFAFSSYGIKDCLSARDSDFYSTQIDFPVGLLPLIGLYPVCARSALDRSQKWEIRPTSIASDKSSVTFDIYKYVPGTCGPACTDVDNDGLKAEGGACGAVDQCPSIKGTSAFNGCPSAIKATAERHTIDSTLSKPRSVKYPLQGLFVAAFDKSQGSCAAGYGISWQNYPAIDANCEAVSGCTTGADGTCVMGVPAGDYLIIGRKLTVTGGQTLTIDDKHLGVSAGDIASGQLMQKYLQLLEVPDLSGNGRKTFPASLKKITGSYLDIVQPDYIAWTGTEELYPFIFTSDSNWTVDVCVYVPEGYKPVDSCLQTFVSGETKALQFKVVEVGSIPGDTDITFNLNHKGKKQTVKTKVGAKVTPALEKAKAAKQNTKGRITGAAIYGLSNLKEIQAAVIVGIAIMVSVIAVAAMSFFNKKKKK